MKKVILILAIFVFSQNQAQISVDVNLGTPPKWAPVAAPEVEYYYLPDVESYYDIRQKQFIYFGNGRWVRSRNLPVMYSNYDLYGGHKVVLADYRGNSPYVYFKKDKVKYYKFKGEKYRPQQQVFHDNNNHQEHKEKKNGKHDNGNRGHKNK